MPSSRLSPQISCVVAGTLGAGAACFGRLAGRAGGPLAPMAVVACYAALFAVSEPGVWQLDLPAVARTLMSALESG